MNEQKKSLFKKLAIMLSAVGPGLFLIGYNIGTGSVTTMASAGSRYGMSLFWTLLLSCIFTLIMLIAFGKYTLVTGNTVLYGFKTQFRYGKIVSISILIMLAVGELISVTGVMGIVTEIINEWSKYFTQDDRGFNQIAITSVIIIILYSVFWIGRYNIFEKLFIVFVTVMGLCFILSMILVIPEPSVIIKGLIPSIPKASNTPLIIASMVGTTLAAPMFVMRSIVVREKGWKLENLKTETRDAIVSVTAMLIISAAIMACAAGTLYPMGKGVENVIDMVVTLEPIAGKFAMSIFIAGIVSAGLSTIFPLILITPWLICDYTNSPTNMQSPMFRILGGLGILLGLVLPVFGGRPVWVMIASGAFSALATPLVVITIIILLNQKSYMKEHKIGLWMNIGCWLTFIFSLIMAYNGFIGLKTYL